MKARATPTVRISRAEAAAHLTGPQSDAVTLIRTTARQVANTAKLRAPVDTGQLRNSHMIAPIEVQAGRVTTEVQARKTYALAVHEGTAARIIRPRKGRFLKFPGRDGTTVFARQVMAPARAPRPWLLNATKAVAAPRGFTVTGT